MKYILSAFILLTANLLYGQVIKEQVEKIGDLTEKISDNYLDDTTSKPNYLVYPSIAYTPETSWELGLTNLVLFYAKNDKRNRLSEISVFSFYTLESQFGIWVDHAIYGNKDKYFYLGKLKYQYFPLKYYGTGIHAPEDNYKIVDSKSFQLRERVLRKVKGHFFAGIELDHHNLYQVKFAEDTTVSLPPGANGSANTALGLGLVYDSRHNVLNERNGFFAEVACLNYAKYLGSDFRFFNVQFDARYFRKGFKKKQVWAFQAIGQFNTGDVPFNQLALMGGENMMRGYYLGRYRDNNLLATQAEYRFLPFPFSKRWGGVLFTAVGTVAPGIGDFRLKDFRPTAGLGIRYLVFRSKDIFVRLDAAFTSEGRGFYFFIGEAF